MTPFRGTRDDIEVVGGFKGAIKNTEESPPLELPLASNTVEIVISPSPDVNLTSVDFKPFTLYNVPATISIFCSMFKNRQRLLAPSLGRLLLLYLVLVVVIIYPFHPKSIPQAGPSSERTKSTEGYLKIISCAYEIASNLSL